MASARKNDSQPPEAPEGADELTAVRPVRRRFRHPSGIRELPRIEQKIRRAETLLATLPANHPKRRLLELAIVRRDETILDAVTAALDSER